MLLILYLRFHHEHLWTGVGGLKPLRVLNHLFSPAPTGLLPPFCSRGTSRGGSQRSH